MSKIAAAIIGFGYWGPNLYRNISHSKHFELKAIIDSDENKLTKISEQRPDLVFSSQLTEKIIENTQAFFIATPAITHFNLANELLRMKKHVWIEKPVSSSIDEIQDLVESAEYSEVVAVADHTYAFAPAVLHIKEIISKGLIGDVLYVHSVRSNLGIFQPDVSVIWDLAIHDLSILSEIIPSSDWLSVSCTVGNPLQGPTDSIADITLKTSKNQYFSIHINWLSPIKIRQMVIGGSNASVIFDDLQMFEKVKITRQSFEVSTENDRKIAAVSYSLGDSTIPRLPSAEPLSTGIDHFALTIKDGKWNTNSLANVIGIYRVLEKAQLSSTLGGKEMKL